MDRVDEEGRDSEKHWKSVRGSGEGGGKGKGYSKRSDGLKGVPRTLGEGEWSGRAKVALVRGRRGGVG